MVEIDIGPNLRSYGQLVLSWHGFYSFIAVATAVILVGRWAPRRGVRSDDIYSIATWGIIAGVIGARAVHVIDEWDFYSNSPGRILQVWSGGIGVWGGILGGFAGAVGATAIMNVLRTRRRDQLEGALSRAKTDEERREVEEELSLNQHLPIGVIAGMTAPAMLFVQAIGRIGDIINGEHCAKAADFFLAFAWTNPESDAGICNSLGTGIGVSVQPVIAYEMLWNMVALVVVWKLRNKLVPMGMVWALYLALYSVGRFSISFARSDDVWALGMQEAHYIAIAVLAVTVPLMAWKARLAPAGGVAADGAAPVSVPRGTRAQRRRRGRR
ncbi:MAG: prolipoprotein diacylglyceryl transferase [Chloroflexi bacterium]|nr:prolipoprotein diacylglyceryl transferase [Chloroflexota bacterium]